MNIVIITKHGVIVKFNSQEVRPCARGSKGMRGITLAEGDEVVSAFAEASETKQ